MNDIYHRITERIVCELEAGTPPWVRPWSEISDPVPTNAISRKAYRGVNTLLLSMHQQACGYESNRWLTYRQARELGGCVRKGEQGCTVTYFEMRSLGEDTEERKVPLLKLFTVFNTAQCEGLPEHMTVVPRTDPTWQGGEMAEEIVSASGVRVINGGFRAFYSPANDRIHLPSRGAFADAPAYYGTALHECAHATGHPTRLNRQFGRRFGDEAYAFEELVAELTSAYLSAHCRIDGRLQHASYIGSWLQILNRDPRAVFTAAAQAQKAADFLIARTQPHVADEVAVAA